MRDGSGSIRREQMDARELTPIVEKNKGRIFLLEKQVEYLTQETEKLRIFVDDMRIDLQMMQNMQRRK